MLRNISYVLSGMRSLSIYFDLNAFIHDNCESLQSRYESVNSFEVNVSNGDNYYKREQSENRLVISSNNSSLEYHRKCSSSENTDYNRSRLNEFQHLNCQHTTTNARSLELLSTNIFFRHVPTNVFEFLIFFGKFMMLKVGSALKLASAVQCVHQHLHSSEILHDLMIK